VASKSPALVVQPKFADQIRQLPSPLGVQLPIQRGYMIWEQPMTSLYGSKGGPLGDGRDMINFLFNPSTVSSDYAVGNASLQAAMMYQVPGDQGNLLAPLVNQSVAWDLYFDRTYELNYGGNSSAVNDPAVIGCQADVYQFMQFTGVLATLNRQQASSILGQPSNGSITATPTSTTGGIMMMIPCYVFFGSALAQMNANPKSANFNALASQLAYYGFISEFSIQYTHWTTNMVPIRCVISVTFTMLPAPPQGAQQAVWRDLYKLGQAPSTAPIPRPPGWQQPPTLIGGASG
jgi:hypothetical protein